MHQETITEALCLQAIRIITTIVWLGIAGNKPIPSKSLSIACKISLKRKARKVCKLVASNPITPTTLSKDNTYKLSKVICLNGNHLTQSTTSARLNWEKLWKCRRDNWSWLWNTSLSLGRTFQAIRTMGSLEETQRQWTRATWSIVPCTGAMWCMKDQQLVNIKQALCLRMHRWMFRATINL